MGRARESWRYRETPLNKKPRRLHLTVAEISPVARCSYKWFSFGGLSHFEFASFSHTRLVNMDSGGVEELYRNYGILADAKDSAGEVSMSV